MGKIYVNDNQRILRMMIEIYQPDNFDWMSYQITNQNILTFHHIVELSKGGLTEIGNGALVTKRGHKALNLLCIRDYILYKNWNELFLEINQFGKSPDDYLMSQSRELKKATHKVLYK